MGGTEEGDVQGVARCGLHPERVFFLSTLRLLRFRHQDKKHRDSAAAFMLWEDREKLRGLRRLRSTGGTGLTPGKHLCPGQGGVLGLNPPRGATCGLRCGLFWKGVIWGELILDSCFTFTFKVEYFSGIGDDGLEKPI